MQAPTLPPVAPEGLMPPLPHDVVARLAAARKSARMTQAELAERAGLSRMTVQRLESNGLDPRLSTLNEMARVLGYELVAVPTALRSACEQLVQQHLQGGPAAPAASE